MIRKTLLPLFLAASVLHAELQDAPAPDIAQMLQVLKALKDQHLAQLKTARDKALRDAQTNAASPSAAVAAWEEAIRETQFEGQPKEGAAFRAWKDKEGESLKEKEVQSAAVLYFRWLVLTLQHAGGKLVKDQLSDVVAYTKDLGNDQVAMESFVENIKREAELAKTGKHGIRPASKANDATTRQLHDAFLRGLNGSAPVKAMSIEEVLKGDKWEMNPGNLDGIYNNIILPELRAQRDPRVLDYWDLRIKRAGDSAARTKLAYDAEKYTNETRPSLLWNKAQEYAKIGLKNRAIAEMFAVLKAFPKHPEASQWVSDFEAVLMPPVAAPVPADGTPASPAVPEPLPGAGPSQPVK